jgi:hypothetical protein
MKERRSVVAAGKEVETRTWWLLLAVVLGSVGCYAVLAVHLVLEATTRIPGAELDGRSGRHLVCIRGRTLRGLGPLPA